MSTIRVSNIQDTSGGNTSTPSAIANGIAKAWVNFNGTGTIAIRSSFNVSSITDGGVGNYTINFSTPFADANYSGVAAGGETANANGLAVATGAFAVGSLQIYTKNTNSGLQDFTFVSAAVFR